MENIVVYLFDVNVFNRYDVENATYEELDGWFKNRDSEEAQKFTLKVFQYAFNEGMIDDVNNWIAFASEK